MNLKSLLAGEKGRKLLIIGAAAVLVLLVLSSVLGGSVSKNSSKVKEVKSPTIEDVSELEQALESRVKALVERIDGAGTAAVMITLDRTSTSVYQKDEKLANSNYENETVLAGSAKEPLQTGTVLPKVRGAAVVCSGAADPVVQEKITNAVAKALNIGISRVYVTN